MLHKVDGTVAARPKLFDSIVLECFVLPEVLVFQDSPVSMFEHVPAREGTVQYLLVPRDNLQAVIAFFDIKLFV